MQTINHRSQIWKQQKARHRWSRIMCIKRRIRPCNKQV